MARDADWNDRAGRVAAGLGWIWRPLALLALGPLIFLFAFFRDRGRRLPGDERSVVSPADGTVSDVTELEHDELLGGPGVRIGIFLSVFNVHVNRSPCAGA
jgi:phosphatidylserine decarboxylase